MAHLIPTRNRLPNGAIGRVVGNDGTTNFAPDEPSTVRSIMPSQNQLE
jgi:hypothetical protein